jgi:hypothetical protein
LLIPVNIKQKYTNFLSASGSDIDTIKLVAFVGTSAQFRKAVSWLLISVNNLEKLLPGFC